MISAAQMKDVMILQTMLDDVIHERREALNKQRFQLIWNRHAKSLRGRVPYFRRNESYTQRR